MKHWPNLFLTLLLVLLSGNPSAAKVFSSTIPSASTCSDGVLCHYQEPSVLGPDTPLVTPDPYFLDPYFLDDPFDIYENT